MSIQFDQWSFFTAAMTTTAVNNNNYDYDSVDLCLQLLAAGVCNGRQNLTTTRGANSSKSCDLKINQTTLKSSDVFLRSHTQER